MITKEQIREILTLDHDTIIMDVVQCTDEFPEELEDRRLLPGFFKQWKVDYIYKHINHIVDEPQQR